MDCGPVKAVFEPSTCEFRMQARTTFFLIALFSSSVTFAQTNENPSYTFSELTKKERMAVVNIRSSLPLSKPGPMKDFFGDLLIGSLQEPLGTGFLISNDGYILTNDHVVSMAREGDIVVHLLDQRQMKARVVGRDPKTDIALLKIGEGRDFYHVSLGNSSESLKVGEWVIAVGNPFGAEETVSVGIVSATGRTIGAGPYDDFIQTDAIIHAGNSGGPVFNIRGEVIGMSTAVPALGQGIGFAIPIDMVKKVASQLRVHGRVTRAWLGVMIQEVTPELAKAFTLHKAEGALVSDVIEQSPAQRAGILRGDVIVVFNGKKVDRMHEMPMIVAETPLGENVEVVFIRDGKEHRIRVIVAELPDEPMGIRPGGQR